MVYPITWSESVYKPASYSLSIDKGLKWKFHNENLWVRDSKSLLSRLDKLTSTTLTKFVFGWYNL